jgi:hypothetical protein
MTCAFHVPPWFQCRVCGCVFEEGNEDVAIMRGFLSEVARAIGRRVCSGGLIVVGIETEEALVSVAVYDMRS